MVTAAEARILAGQPYFHLLCYILLLLVYIYLSIYFGRTRTNLVSFSHSALSAMTAGSSCLGRPVSSSSWSTNVVVDAPLSVCRALGPREVAGKQSRSCFSNSGH